MLQAIVLQSLLQQIGGKRIGKQKFHRAKTVLRGGGEAV
jgi:hypothetical protein